MKKLLWKNIVTTSKPKDTFKLHRRVVLVQLAAAEGTATAGGYDKLHMLQRYTRRSGHELQLEF